MNSKDEIRKPFYYGYINKLKNRLYGLLCEKEKDGEAASEVFVEPSQSGDSEAVDLPAEEKMQEGEIPSDVIHVQDSE